MAKLSEMQWEEISTLYRTGTPIPMIAKAYSITRQTVHDRVRRYGWARDLASDIDLATEEKLTGLTSATAPADRAAIVSSLSDDRAALILSHRNAWDGIYGLDTAAMRVLAGEPSVYTREPLRHPKGTKDGSGKDLSGQLILDAKGEVQWHHPVLDAKDRISLSARLMALFEKRSLALQTAQEGQRRAHGFDYKMQIEVAQEDDEEMRELNEQVAEMLRLVELNLPGRIATNENEAKITDTDTEGDDER